MKAIFLFAAKKNNFNCFAPSCGAHGNVIDFVAGMEKCSIRDAALKIQDWFSIPGNGRSAGPAKVAGPVDTKTGSQLAPGKRGERGESNKPLTFQLKGIDHSHPYLIQRGIEKETAERFGVGLFSGKGSMSGRVVIPIHNERGELIAYAGRVLEEGTEERYRFPSGFKKSLVLFNLHRVLGESREVVLVEGFFDCLKVWQAGFPVVALMGSSLSEKQEELLVENFRAVHLLLDGDEAGREAIEECLRRLGKRIWVKASILRAGRWTLEEDRQPDQLSREEIISLF